MKNALVALAALAMLAGCSSKDGTVHVDAGIVTEKDASNATGATDVGSDVLTKADDTPVANDNPPGTVKTDDPLATDKPVEVVNTEPGKFATKDFFGMYDGKLDLPPEFFEQMSKNVPPEQLVELERQFKSIIVTLELKTGDRYVLTTSGAGQSQSENGKWTYDKAKNVVTLQAPEVSAERREQLIKSGRTAAEIDAMQKESQNATVSTDGRTLVMQRGEMGLNFKLTFSKR